MNYLGHEAIDMLPSGIPRDSKVPSVGHENTLLPLSAQTTHMLGDAWGGVTALNEAGSTMLVRKGRYVSSIWGGPFRVYVPPRRGVRSTQVGGAGPLFGTDSEGDAVLGGGV